MKIINDRLADYVAEHPSLLNFLDRLEIRLGFGDKTVRQVCKENGVDLFFFVELLNLVIQRHEFDPQNIHLFSTSLTLRYLRNSHKSYLADYLPKLGEIIDELKRNEKGRAKDCKVLKKYFVEYKKEFYKHLNHEDSVIFPYIENLNANYEFGIVDEEITDKIRRNSIQNYAKEHESLDEKVRDLKYLIIKYIEPFQNSSIIRFFLKILLELERDLNLHEMIENRILFKQAEQIEKEILAQKIKSDEK